MHYAALCGLVAAGITIRWFYRGQYLEGWDSVDFAFALQNFDLEKYQPHFPGYPVYIALAKGSQWVVGHDVMHDTEALILPGVIFGTLAMIPMTLLAAQWTQRHTAPTLSPDSFTPTSSTSRNTEKSALWAGFIAAGLYLLGPGLWLQTEKPLSDALGLALLPWVFFVFMVALESDADASQRSWLMGLAGVLMGLVLGVRLSYWPFVVGCALVMWLRRPPRMSTLIVWGCGGLGVGTCLWSIPLLAHTGLPEFVQESIRFGTGHFTRWGGTVFSNDAGMERYTMWWWDTWAFSLGGYWPEAPQNIWRVMVSISFCLAIFWAIVYKPLRPMVLTVGTLILPYAAWILIGQNPERPRHALPLVLFLYPLAGAAIGTWMTRWMDTPLKYLAHAVGMIAIVGSTFVAFPLVNTYANTIPPQVAFVRHVQANFDPSTTRVFTWETQRLFAYYAPQFDTTRARGLNDVLTKVRETDRHSTILFSSKLGQKHSKYHCFDYLTTFRRSMYVEPWFWTLSLFSYCGAREEPQKQATFMNQRRLL